MSNLLLESEAIREVLDYLEDHEYEDYEEEEERTPMHNYNNTWRPNAHGGLHCSPSNRCLQPMSNKLQKLPTRFRAAPLEEKNYYGKYCVGICVTPKCYMPCPKYDRRSIEWEEKSDIAMSNSVRTEISETLRGMSVGKTKRTDKSDRATVEQALDPRTRSVLYKMINRRVFDYIGGCIATGKEANVYYATASEGQELAIKVYKTSVLVFRDRDLYVEGDSRFTRRYCKSNPRKMVTEWALKEWQNLQRLRNHGIRCPNTIELRGNVLVMEFIGEGGQNAPRLKDAVLPLNKLCKSYIEIIVAMRTMYQKCRLVHGDLSEYNILYFKGHLYLIDVSQSVNLDHEHARDFLERDCKNVSVFFMKHGVAFMTTQELLDFVDDSNVDDDSVESYLEEAQQKNLARGGLISAENETADSTLDQVKPNAEGQMQDIIKEEDTKDMDYDQTTMGQERDLSTTDLDSTQINNIIGSSDDDDEEEDSDSEKGSFAESVEQTPVERKAARKENKKKVKEEKREGRKCKVPKAVRKKRKKLSKAKKCR